MRRFFAHLEPGGALVMPFGLVWELEGWPLETGWYTVFEKTRPEDGATVRRRSRSRFTPENQLWHTEDRYDVERDGVLLAGEDHQRSPAGRWYTQTQAIQLYREAGFRDVLALRSFTHTPAAPDEKGFCLLGIKEA